MIFTTAVEVLDQRNADGRILNRRTGKYGRISEGTRNGLVSSTRVALRAATGRSDVEDVDILPLAEALPDHAYADAEEAGHANPANAADRVRRFLAIVEGREHRKTRGGAKYLPPPWRRLYESAAKAGRHYPPRVAKLYRVAAAPKPDGSDPVLDPRALPDRDTVQKWLMDSGLPRRRASRIIRAYQLARQELPEGERPSLPPLDEYRPTLERGLRSLPNLEQLLADSELSAKEFLRLPPLERIRVVSPQVHYGVTRYLEANPTRSGGWRKAAILGVERMLAAMELSGHPLSEHSPMDLYTKTTAIETAADTPRNLNPLMAQRYGESDGVTAESRHLIREVIDAAARLNFASSPLELVHDQPGKDVPYYTATVMNDARHWYQMTREAYREAARICPADWSLLAAVQVDLQKHMKTVNSNRFVTGQKNKEAILDIITLPQIVCIGLPALRRRVLTLRDAYHRALCRHGDNPEKHAIARARRSYGKLLRDYLVAAVMISDGLRVANYSGARMGVHIIPNPTRGDNGRWTSLQRVETAWRGFDDGSVRLKIARDELGAERKRNWHLLPGIVDLDLLHEYLLDVRIDDLVSAGLLPSADAYDPDQDLREWHFALFPSGHPSSCSRAGCYSSTQSISSAFGRILHWMATEVLGRDLPEWGDPELTEKYRGLFSGHITRLQLATYWGGVRGEWTRACMLTDDTEDTLRRSYSRVGARLIERMSRNDWMNPNHFNEEMDRIFRDEVIDWEGDARSGTTRPQGLDDG